MIGTRLAHYEITSHLGTGGMGEVYQANDTKLGRSVAIKLLPEAFSHDSDRLSRFEREARMLASLNHPNIAAIYGLEESGGRKFLVMELVPGETLAERIKRDPILMDEALAIAKQIADALQAAHDSEKGIIHRDLKPANVKITPEGKLKVLDFGLAKAFEAQPSDTNPSNSPTLSNAATQQGLILGTAAYMSPEQAKGRMVDKRTDIFAFGCVLYEMLTGWPAFEGDGVGEILARVIERDPNWTKLPSNVPPRFRELLRRSLQKDPRKRWRDVGDLRIELELAGETPVGTAPPEGMPLVPRSRRERALWLSAILGAAILTWLAASFLNSRSPRDAPAGLTDLVRFSEFPPAGASFYAGAWIVPFAVSPDGRWFAFTATSDDGKSRLWFRALKSETAQPIPGTEGAVSPFWSPDSKWLGFRALNVWYQVRIAGGSPEIISPFRGFTDGSLGAAWGDDVILYTGANGAIFKVSFPGGRPSQLTTLDPSSREVHQWPQFLSDGRHFLYVVTGKSGGIYVDSIDGGQRALVIGLESSPITSPIRYVPGYLLYVENGVLWAHAFDETSYRLIGERRPVVSGLPQNLPSFSASHTGVLAYWTQSPVQQGAQLRWIDRDGTRGDLVGEPAVYDGFDLSRNGSRVVSSQVGKEGIDLFVRDVGVGNVSFFPLKNKRGTVPIWTPDGKQVVFLCRGSLCLADADKTANTPVPLTAPSRNQLPQSFTRLGDRLVYEEWTPENLVDLKVLDMKDKSVASLGLNTTSANEFGGRLSPDDRWLAYVTDQTGRNEVWVTAFPSGQPSQVSLSGGSHPEWKGDSTELYFISAEGKLVAVSFGSDGSRIDVRTRTNLFSIPRTVDVMSGSHNIYKPSRDGQKFLVAVRSDVANVPPISVIMNWTQLLSGKE
jgi:serine/threonine protein kinase/Tol biopolymer transport system component